MWIHCRGWWAAKSATLLTLATECEKTSECKPAKHHYDECVDRVTAAADSEKGTKEDCIEECKSSPATGDIAPSIR